MLSPTHIARRTPPMWNGFGTVCLSCPVDRPKTNRGCIQVQGERRHTYTSESHETAYRSTGLHIELSPGRGRFQYDQVWPANYRTSTNIEMLSTWGRRKAMCDGDTCLQAAGSAPASRRKSHSDGNSRTSTHRNGMCVDTNTNTTLPHWLNKQNVA